ncbi:MAG TPA: twin-arginine translocase TatA/TatE family subunit [Phycisphaerales bacterium]|nr:twin-arginine translocase TatA/TatE family subunit [Phycisphaerales bacterium]
MFTTFAADPMLTLAFFNFSGWELLLIGGIGLLVFGSRLPSVGRNLGRGITEFKKGLKDAGDEISREDEDRRPAISERGYRAPLTAGGEDRRVVQGERVETRSE